MGQECECVSSSDHCVHEGLMNVTREHDFFKELR